MDFAKPEDLHVWLVDLDGEAAVGAVKRNLLSPDEQERASRFVMPVHQRRFAASRSVLRDLLGKYCDMDPATVPLCLLEHGKPALDLSVQPEPWARRVEFNLSHSDRYALVAFSEKRFLGVDLEKHNERVNAEAIASSYLSVQERKQMFAQPSARRQQTFFRIWVLKEAFMKYTGLGMSLPLDQFSVDIEKPAQTRLLSVDEKFQQFERCDLFDLVAPAGFSAALAVQRTDSIVASENIHQFNYSI